MAELFERDNEWGGFIIDFSKEGFLVKYHAHNKGEMDGLQVLVPYGTWGFSRIIDLEASWDGIVSNGEALAAMALDDVKAGAASGQVRVLDAESVSRGREAVTAPVQPKAPIERPWRKKESGITWYTFSVSKTDELEFGNCHDLFTTMYLTHGLPRGMALWVKSKGGQNTFFVQVPDSVNATNDPFFRMFPLAECGSPSKIGLSLLAGNAAKA